MNPVAAFIDNLTAEQERRHAWLLRAAEQIREENAMSDRLPGTSYDNPIWHRGYRIHLGPGYTRDGTYEFSHKDFDGAPDHMGEGPADQRYGMAESVAACMAEIDEIEDSTRDGGAPNKPLPTDPSDCPDCDGFGMIWNNADPTSGQWVACGCGDTRGQP